MHFRAIMNACSVRAKAEVKSVPNMIFFHYHDYSDYLLECRATEDVPSFSYLKNLSKNIFVTRRVDTFKVYINVLHSQKFVNKK